MEKENRLAVDEDDRITEVLKDVEDIKSYKIGFERGYAQALEFMLSQLNSLKREFRS